MWTLYFSPYSTKGWTVRDRIPVGTRFSARPDRPWNPPSLLFSRYRVFPGGKVRPGRAADHSPPSSAVVMEEYSYNSTHPLGHTGPVTGSLYLFTMRCIGLCRPSSWRSVTQENNYNKCICHWPPWGWPAQADTCKEEYYIITNVYVLLHVHFVGLNTVQ